MTIYSVNQCDGCISGAELRSNNMHYGKDGLPFMVCQREKYLTGQQIPQFQLDCVGTDQCKINLETIKR
jgi:hypothetical protein